ncbi:hypothetical protein Tco_0370452 [Tanacetum coccineum]
MGDANPIRTLGDYSKPSHEGYMNTIKLLVGNNGNKMSYRKGLSHYQEVSQYEDEGWNDPVILEEGNLNYENPNIEPLLGVMEYKVDTLMKNAISLMGRSEGEERVKQLEEYMRVIVDDFMQLSLEVTRRLKEKIIKEGSRIRKIEKIIKYPDIKVPKPLTGHKFSESSGASLIGGEQREISLLELGCRIGLYTERKYRDNATLSRLSRTETVKENCLLMEFWPSIGDGGFNVGNTKVASIRNPSVKLAHRCLATTISGRKESTHRVTKINLYYLYCIYREGVV